MTRTITALLAAALLAGCATSGSKYEPLVDMKDKSVLQYHTDVRECQAYADTRPSDTSAAIGGAIAGALLGAAIAPRGYRNSTATAGATGGSVAGGMANIGTKENIIKRCMAGRGYSVLN